MNITCSGVVVLACVMACAANAADAPAPARPRDAAEAVQEGNVKNWIEYYQRAREPAPVQSPAVPPAAPREPATPAPPAPGSR